MITYLTSIPAALFLYSPVLHHTNYIVGTGANTRVALGALLEVLLIIANVGTAVVLFPILKRQNEGVALGYVGAHGPVRRSTHHGQAAIAYLRDQAAIRTVPGRGSYVAKRGS